MKMNSQRKRKNEIMNTTAFLSTIALVLLVSAQPAVGVVSAVSDGATFPQPFIQVTMSAFDGLHSGYQLTYGGGGSGKGQSDIENNLTQFGGSDAPLSDAARTAHPGILHIPETIGSVTLSYTVPNATTTGCPSPYSKCLPKDLNLTASIIAEIYMGNITMWNDPAIKAINPAWTSFLPAHAITTVHRCDSSGTTFVFTNFLSLASPNNWQKNIGNGTSVNWGTNGTPAGVCGTGNAGVASQVVANPYYIGYVELNYAIANSLSFAKVNEALDGKFIEPSLTSTQVAVAAGAGSLPSGDKSWAHVSLLNESAAGAYPIASFSYFLIHKDMTTSASSLAVANLAVSYIWYHVHDGQALASGLYYVPLPASVITIDENTLNSITYNGGLVSHFLSSGTPALPNALSIALLSLLIAAEFVAVGRRKTVAK